MLSKPMKLTKRGEVTPLTKRLEGRWWEESSVELSLVQVIKAPMHLRFLYIDSHLCIQ